MPTRRPQARVPRMAAHRDSGPANPPARGCSLMSGKSNSNPLHSGSSSSAHIVVGSADRGFLISCELVEPPACGAPSSSTRSWKARVSRRCAIVSTAAPKKGTSPPLPRLRPRSMRCTSASVFGSQELVASSKTTTFAFRSSARVIVSSCRWPADIFAPPSATAMLRPPACCTKSARSTCSKASQSCSSRSSARGSRFSRRLPA
mmetsp:Transcript_68889/g.177496  ORF Transcript_68889/g.177496 Transcript_68889/m.177496 type:complete len:204 (+) Transcript_68889:110-721(+)